MAVLHALKDIISVKIKARHDSLCDQFSRLLMTKMLFISAILLGVDYFTDKIYCIHQKDSTVDKNFVSAACWISGFFIYEEMVNRPQLSSHFGIPFDISKNGIKDDGTLCMTHNKRQLPNSGCNPMTRVMYTQYQWMPFYIGALGLMFYLPYIVFRIVNVDLISLKSVIKSMTVDADQLVKNYFNYKINPVRRLRLRVFFNVFVKCLYIAVNLFAFYFTDYLLNNKFINYGNDYYAWAKDSTSKFRYSSAMNRIQRPGDKLLPSMGYCTIEEAAQHETDARYNRYVFLCEFSSNIMYQYVLVVLWLMFVVSTCISILGLLVNITGYLFPTVFYTLRSKHVIYRYLTLREFEYLQFIQKKNMVLYGEILRKLRQQRPDLQGKMSEDFDTNEPLFTRNGNEVKPTAPPSTIELLSFRFH